jgi:prolipoprotein diacylglyceryl transferase
MATVFASIPSPSSNGFHLGPLFLHAYGLAYVVGIAAAIALTTRRWERAGGRRDVVFDVALWGVPAGLIGGRLYHLATSWNEVPHAWWGPLAIWRGGLGIWGGIAAGTLAGLWRLRRGGVPIRPFMDAAAPGLLVAQAVGRIGNYFNQELFGAPTTLPWALRVDPSHRPAGYEGYATFHPIFLYEFLFDLVLAGALIALGRSGRVRAPGLFALYVAGYSGFRIFEELLRIDPAHQILGMRVNFFVAVALCVAGLGWFALIQWPRRSKRTVRRGVALVAAGCVTCSFAACARSAHAGPSRGTIKQAELSRTSGGSRGPRPGLLRSRGGAERRRGTALRGGAQLRPAGAPQHPRDFRTKILTVGSSPGSPSTTRARGSRSDGAHLR